MSNHKIKRCVSLYSFQDEMMRGVLTLEGCLAKLNEFGAEGVEILGDAVFPGFPRLSNTTLHNWREMLERYNLTPVCHDMFLDIRINGKREMSLEEQTDSLIRDIIYARKLGMQMIRVIANTPVPVMEKAAPYAEKFNVKLGLEVHSPWNFESDHVQQLLEVIHRIDNGYLGFIPDCGLFFKRFPRIVIENARLKGIDEKFINYMVNLFETGQLKGMKNSQDIMNFMNRLFQEVNGMGGGKQVMEAFGTLLGYTWNDPTCMLSYMPYIFHVHAKFLEMTDEGIEYSIPYDQVIDVLKEGGYSGYLSSEYEGGIYSQLKGDVDGIGQVRKQQAMIKRLLQE